MKNIVFIALVLLTHFLHAHDLGKQTYEIACKTCHAPEFAKGMQAPTAFDKHAWKPRFKQAAIEAKKHPEQFQTPLDYMLYKVGKGKGLMPHGGLCKEADVPDKNCSSTAIKAAILYMANVSKAKIQ